jgi:hypothetical protein
VYEILTYDHSPLPNLKSDLAKRLCKELWEEYQYYEHARSSLEQEIWPACDRAYQCIRTLPQNEGMDWVDNSDLGETDLRDAVKFLAESTALSLMPRDQSWFEPVPIKAEDQPHMNSIRDYLQMMHRKANTRAQYEKHLKQVYIRGTGAITWTWKRKVRQRRLGPAKSMRMLAEAAQMSGIDVTQKELSQLRQEEVTFSGLVVTPLDMMDVYLDPTADLISDEDLPVIVRKYMTIDDLKNTKDAKGNPVYTNLEGLTPLSIGEIYSKNPKRFEAYENLGINPIAADSPTAKYVPVLCFHRAHRRFEDQVWVDTYFYMAYGGTGKDDLRLIAAFENPSDYGHRPVFIDTYDTWLNSAYGVGVVEKSLPAWQHKNVLAALTLQSQLATVFPAWNVIGGMLLDDRRLRLAPGSVNHISLKPSIGTNFMAPVPVPKDAQQLGELAQRFAGQKILGQTGAYGAMLNDPTRAITESKTATQINTETTSGAVGRDNYIERITNNSLEPLMQVTLDAAKQYAEDLIEFEAPTADGFMQGQIRKEDLLKAKSIVVTGFHGMMNKANEIRELNESLVAMAQAMGIPGVMGNVLPLYVETLFKLLARLGIQNLEQYKGDPIQLLMSIPEIQQQFSAALQQAEMSGVQQGAEAAAEEMSGTPMPEDAGQGPKMQQDQFGV